jgi:hypothetical protein
MQLFNDQENIRINPNTRLCSFDIANMYTNIPITHIKGIIQEVLHNNNT